MLQVKVHALMILQNDFTRVPSNKLNTENKNVSDQNATCDESPSLLALSFLKMSSRCWALAAKSLAGMISLAKLSRSVRQGKSGSSWKSSGYLSSHTNSTHFNVLPNRRHRQAKPYANFSTVETDMELGNGLRPFMSVSMVLKVSYSGSCQFLQYRKAVHIDFYWSLAKAGHINFYWSLAKAVHVNFYCTEVLLRLFT